jgi:hypothetical protein
MRRACAPGRSFAIDQVSRLLALRMEYRRIALSKEGVFGWRSDFSNNRMIVGDQDAFVTDGEDDFMIGSAQSGRC